MQFKLLEQHYLPGDRLLTAGTIVGDGTPYPIDWAHYPPTHEMEGLDPEAVKAAAAAMARFMRTDPIETLPITDGGISPIGVKK